MMVMMSTASLPILQDYLHVACETIQNYHTLSERHLHVLWFEQKGLHHLKTEQGNLIRVISPGIWNTGAGPDFLKAELEIEGRRYRGDIEIHVVSEGWFQHGHHEDKRYNDVILHLTYVTPLSSLYIHKQNGEMPFISNFESALTFSFSDWMSTVDLDLYPNKEFSEKGNCAQIVFGALSHDQKRDFFQAAAYWRLERKVSFLEQQSLDPSLQFVSGIAMALGYRDNAKAFLELFFYLLDYRELTYEELFAISLGCCGFLEEGRKIEWDASAYYQHLRLLWWEKRDQITHQAHLKLHHIRPLNHPIRRLAYLVRLLQDARLEKLWETHLKIWETESQHSKPDFIRLKKKLWDVLPIYEDAYWSTHYTFESQSQKKPLATIGKDLRLHILLNATLPLLYKHVREKNDSALWNTFQGFYGSLKVAETKKSRYLHHRLFPDSQSKELWKEAQIVQGAYQLHHDFCVHFESSCRGCPFIERFQHSFHA